MGRAVSSSTTCLCQGIDKVIISMALHSELKVVKKQPFLNNNKSNSKIGFRISLG